MCMYLTVKETADHLGVTRASVYIAIRDGRLPSDRKFGKIVINDKDANAYRVTVGVRNGFVKRGDDGQSAPQGAAHSRSAVTAARLQKLQEFPPAPAGRQPLPNDALRRETMYADDGR